LLGKIPPKHTKVGVNMPAEHHSPAAVCLVLVHADNIMKYKNNSTSATKHTCMYL